MRESVVFQPNLTRTDLFTFCLRHTAVDVIRRTLTGFSLHALADLYLYGRIIVYAMASSKIERVLRQALTTFSDDSRSPQVFRDNFTKLQQIAGQLDAQSVGFDTSLLQWNQYEWESPSERRRRRVPVTYIEIFENRHISVNVFVIRDGGGLPLHDHPSMHGLLKVIHGKIKIQSYTPRQKDCSRLR